ncbi:MAG: hypothetical protein K6E12_10215 [Saccharofermentans sp.]|nr:hypothetical protein [Saccharofermentans sp.]
MKILKKSLSILKSRSGETMVEVLVAFTLLSLMLLIFAQGLSYAANAEVRAVSNRKDADQSMIALQKKLSSANPKTSEDSISVTSRDPINVDSGEIIPYVYTVDGNAYTVFMPVTED